MNRHNPGRHNRRSIRLPGYDYTQVGAYFVTVVTQNRLCLFGDIENGTMRLNEAGHMVRASGPRFLLITPASASTRSS